jgi:cell division transport system permease protein
MSNTHLKTALGYMRRSPFQALSAIFVLSLTFFVATLLSVLVYSSSKVLNYFETRPQVIAFLKDEATTETISALQHKLSADSRVKEVRYVTKEEALSIYKKATADNPLLGELVSPSIFPASLEFSVVDLSHTEEVLKEIKSEAIVESVGFTASLGGEKTLQDVVGRLEKITWYIRIGGSIFVGTLGIASFTVLLVIISMRMAMRKEEIEILGLIGATPGFIRSPIILEAVIYSIIGVFVGWISTFILILYLAPTLVSYFGQIPILPKGAGGIFILFGIILMGEFIMGNLLALVGSLIAVSRARKNR